MSLSTFVFIVTVTDFTGEEEDSLWRLSFRASGILLTFLTRNLPFFLIELLCLTLDEMEDIVIFGGNTYVEEDNCVSTKVEALFVPQFLLLKDVNIYSIICLPIFFYGICHKTTSHQRHTTKNVKGSFNNVIIM